MKKNGLLLFILAMGCFAAHAQTWVLLNPMPGAARNNALSFAAGSHGYFGFGSQSQPDTTALRQYNPLTDSWSAVLPLPQPLSPAESFGIGTNGYVGLGNTMSGPSPVFYRYNTATNNWSPISSFPSPFLAQAAGFGLNGLAYLAGGAWPGTQTAKDSCYSYDPSSDSWHLTAPLPLAISGACGFAYNGLGYCALGKLNADSVSRGVYIYHPASDTWTNGSPYPGKVSGYRYCHFVFRNAVYFCNDSAQLWQYLPLSDQWQRLADTPFRMGGGAFVLNGVPYVIAAGTNQIWKFCPPLHANAGPDVSICKGSQTTLQGSGTGIAAYAWNPASGLSNANISNPIASPADSTRYVLTLTDSSGCQEQDTVQVFVNPLPLAHLLATSTALCLGDTVGLQASGGANYSWTPSTGLSNPNIPNPAASPQQTLTYTLTLTSPQHCRNTDSIRIVVNKLPIIRKQTNHLVCKGFAAYIQLSGAKTYLWSPASTLYSDTASFQRASPLVNTTYTITATDSNGCHIQDTLFMRVNPVPQIHMLRDSLRICAGDSVQLEVSGAPGYSWLPFGNFNGSSDSSVWVSPPGSATYTVYGMNQFHCRTEATAFVDVNNPAPPLISLHADVLQSSAASGNQWYLNGTAINGATGPTDTVSVNGTYTVCAKNSQGCRACSSPLNVNLAGIQNLQFDFSFSIYPNPAQDVLFLSYELSTEAFLKADLFAADGTFIRRLFAGKSSPGTQKTELETRQVKSGFYTIEITISDQIFHKKVFILH